MDSLMQNGLTPNQVKHTKNPGGLFLDKPYCPAQGLNLKRDGLQKLPSIVS